MRPRSGMNGRALPALAVLTKPQWPTPLADDANNNGGASRVRSFRLGRYTGLNAAVVVAGEPHGSLNPVWVEWLMGFPLEWTVEA